MDVELVADVGLPSNYRRGMKVMRENVSILRYKIHLGVMLIM